MKAIRQRSHLLGGFMVDWCCGLTHIALPCDLRRTALQHLPLFRQPRSAYSRMALRLLCFCPQGKWTMDGEGVDCDNRWISMQRCHSVRLTRWKGDSADATTQY